ncbi:MAG: hypothetical protein IK115_09755 [Lachnospiraceae bacterium]|nr:hypothetical protein [Lachnospiraceae bacterium]
MLLEHPLTLTTLILDGAAILLMLCLLLFSGHLRRHKRMEGKLFFFICVLTILFAVVNAGSHAMHFRDYDTWIVAAKICRTLSDIAPMLILFQWMVFVDYTLYKSRDNLLRRYKFAFVLILLCIVMLIVNLFTGIAYEFDEELFTHAHVPFYVMLIIEYLFLLLSFFVIIQYRVRNKGQNFFMIFPFAIPVLAGVALNDIHPELGTFGIGTAVGLVMMYIFMYRGIALVDEDTGFYKADLLELLKKVPANSEIGGTGIVFTCENADEKIQKILADNKPADSIMVQLNEKDYLLLAAGQRESAIKILIECVTEEAEEAGLKISSRYERQKKGESSEEFLKKFE